MERALLIALQARRVGLLANRSELLYPEAPVRAERALGEGLHPLDVLLVGGAAEADRLGAVGVQMLRSDTSASGPIRDLLGTLPSDDLLAVYHCLPAEVQRYCRRDPVWAYALAHAPDGIAGHIAELEGLRTTTAKPDRLDDLTGDERAEFLRFSDNLLRRSMGMPPELTEQEEACAVAGERAVAVAFDDSLT